MLWPSVSIAAKIESSPRTGISRLISQEPLEKAPVHMTIHQSAHERAPRRNRSRRKVTASGRFLEKGNSDIKSVSTSAPMYQGYGWRLIVDFAVSAKIDAMISEKINNIDIWLPPFIRFIWGNYSEPCKIAFCECLHSDRIAILYGEVTTWAK